MRARRMRTALGCIYPFSVKRELRMLGRAEYLAKEDLLSLQEDRLKRLLQHDVQPATACNTHTSLRLRAPSGARFFYCLTNADSAMHILEAEVS